MYFQQDSAPAQNSKVLRDYLNSVFPRRWIGTESRLKWPVRSSIPFLLQPFSPILQEGLSLLYPLISILCQVKPSFLPTCFLMSSLCGPLDTAFIRLWSPEDCLLCPLARVPFCSDSLRIDYCTDYRFHQCPSSDVVCSSLDGFLNPRNTFSINL